MTDTRVEWVVHEEGALPLRLTGREEVYRKTQWFKEVVAKVRLNLSSAHEGVWNINELSHLADCFTDFGTINEHFVFCDEHQMRRSLAAAEANGHASNFCESFLDGDYEEATNTLTDWCVESVAYLLARVKEKAPQYFDGTWVIIAASIIAAPEKTIVTLKFEWRSSSKEIPKKTALATFIDECMGVAAYWGKEGETPEKAADGAVFSMLNLLDGCKMELPLMDIVLRPHPEDKPYHVEQGEDYYVDGQVINDEVMLHEEYSFAQLKNK